MGPSDETGDGTVSAPDDYASCECDECDPIFPCWKQAAPCFRLHEPTTVEVKREFAVLSTAVVLTSLQAPAGYTAEELERDNPYNAWMQDMEV